MKCIRKTEKKERQILWLAVLPRLTSPVRGGTNLYPGMEPFLP